jgi:serine/threonine protein kinase
LDVKAKELSGEVKIRVVKGIAAGIHHLHLENVIHRDLAVGCCGFVHDTL